MATKWTFMGAQSYLGGTCSHEHSSKCDAYGEELIGCDDSYNRCCTYFCPSFLGDHGWNNGSRGFCQEVQIKKPDGKIYSVCLSTHLIADLTIKVGSSLQYGLSFRRIDDEFSPKLDDWYGDYSTSYGENEVEQITYVSFKCRCCKEKINYFFDYDSLKFDEDKPLNTILETSRGYYGQISKMWMICIDCYRSESARFATDPDPKSDMNDDIVYQDGLSDFVKGLIVIT